MDLFSVYFWVTGTDLNFYFVQSIQPPPPPPPISSTNCMKQ